jgi:hypothetical protein
MVNGLARRTAFHERLGGDNMVDRINNFKLPKFLSGEGAPLDNFLGRYIHRSARPSPQDLNSQIYDDGGAGYQRAYTPEVRGPANGFMNKMDQSNNINLKRMRDDGAYMQAPHRKVFLNNDRTARFSQSNNGYNGEGSPINPAQYDFLKQQTNHDYYNDRGPNQTSWG